MAKKLQKYEINVSSSTYELHLVSTIEGKSKPELELLAEADISGELTY